MRSSNTKPISDKRRFIHAPDRSLTILLLIVLGLLLCAFVGTMASADVQELIGKYLGLSKKNEILRSLGIGMGGVLVAIQALLSHRRSRALEDTARAQADAATAQARATEEQAKANHNTERGQRQERLKNAIEHLGNPFDSVRMGGAYELFHLAADIPELRQTVLDILCAHIRQTTSRENYQDTHLLQPSEEIQTLLTLLFVREHGVFEEGNVSLKGSWLRGAELSNARLNRADLAESEGCGSFATTTQ